MFIFLIALIHFFLSVFRPIYAGTVDTNQVEQENSMEEIITELSGRMREDGSFAGSVRIKGYYHSVNIAPRGREVSFSPKRADITADEYYAAEGKVFEGIFSLQPGQSL